MTDIHVLLPIREQLSRIEEKIDVKIVDSSKHIATDREKKHVKK